MKFNIKLAFAGLTAVTGGVLFRMRQNMKHNEDVEKIMQSSQNNDTLILAQTIYGEAAGEGKDGQTAVANVVMNRFRSRRWFSASTVASVCLKKWQFSCWNSAETGGVIGVANLERGSNFTFNQCLDIAELAINNKLVDLTMGSTHYHTKFFTPEMKTYPSWAKGEENKQVAFIGNHIFYRNIN